MTRIIRLAAALAALAAGIASAAGIGLAQRSPESFRYVEGLDPGGDGFAPLRAGPRPGAPAVALLPEGMPLALDRREGGWARVVLPLGLAGWIEARLLGCCVDSPAHPGPVLVPEDCGDLWLKRNAIWDRRGYCFATGRGRATFDNSDCSRSLEEARAAMTDDERRAVARFVRLEEALGCR